MSAELASELSRARANVSLWRHRVEESRAGTRLWADDRFWLKQWQIEVRRLKALATGE